MKLYLARHGESLPPDVDPDQGLSEKGIGDTEAISRFLKPAHLEIKEIWHSVKKRAQQTAEILSFAITPRPILIQREGLKPMDLIEPLVEVIHSSEHNLMLVGHLPFMEKLLTTLVLKKEQISPVDFCGSCIVCLEGNGSHWQITWILSPKLVS